MNKEFTEFIAGRLHALLSQFGFKKSGKQFTQTINDLTKIIKIQSSRASTSDILIFTINIEIRSAFLYSLQDTSLKEKQVVHYFKRIGDYLEPKTDMWWKVVDNKSLLDANGEMNDLIKNKVISELSQINTIYDLKMLWQKNISPGLTEHLRKEYINLLEAAKV